MSEIPGPWKDGGTAIPPPEREPVFNLPGVIVVASLVLILVQVARSVMLTPEQDWYLVLAFAFIPASYSELGSALPLPSSGLWTPISYSLLHGDWLHLAMNLLWMLAFGTPVARRLGWARFLMLSAVASIGGAAMHFAFYPFNYMPVIGASAIVAGHMGAAARFALVAPRRRGEPFRHDAPALGLVESLTNRRFMAFLAVWMALNFLFGSGIVPIGGADESIAWQAHVGGFLAGMLAFSLFDPVPRRNASMH